MVMFQSAIQAAKEHYREEIPLRIIASRKWIQGVGQAHAVLEHKEGVSVCLKDARLDRGCLPKFILAGRFS